MYKDDFLVREYLQLRQRFEVHLIENRYDCLEIYLYNENSDSVQLLLDNRNYPGSPQIKILNIKGNNIFRELLDATTFYTVFYSFDWNEILNGKHFVDFVIELEESLFETNQLLYEYTQIAKEHRILSLSKAMTLIELFTYDYSTFLINVDFSTYPNRPILSIPPESETSSIHNNDELIFIDEWEPQSHVSEILNTIQYKIINATKFSSEISLMQSTASEVNYDADLGELFFSVQGKERFLGQKFVFSLKLSPEYPAVPPILISLSEVSDPILEVSLQNYARNMVEGWNENILLHEIALKIKSIIDNEGLKYICMVCRQIIEDLNLVTRCQHCNRPYHSNCWNEIKSRTRKCIACWQSI